MPSAPVASDPGDVEAGQAAAVPHKPCRVPGSMTVRVPGRSSQVPATWPRSLMPPGKGGGGAGDREGGHPAPPVLDKGADDALVVEVGADHLAAVVELEVARPGGAGDAPRG
jgi:hypothetical protein